MNMCFFQFLDGSLKHPQKNDERHLEYQMDWIKWWLVIWKPMDLPILDGISVISIYGKPHRRPIVGLTRLMEAWI